MSNKKKKLDLSKKIVIWGMVITTAYIVMYVVSLISFNIFMPSDLTELIKVIVLGTTIPYAGKSGAENYRKIKNANETYDETANGRYSETSTERYDETQY